MIHIKQRATLTSGMRKLVGTRTATVRQSAHLPTSSVKLLPKAVLGAVPAIKNKRIDAHDKKLTAGMRRILRQYKSDTYFTAGYSQRSCQRHRKFFLELGIDLREPYKPTASTKLPVPKLTKRSTKPLLVKKKRKQLPKPVPTHRPSSSRSERVSDFVSAKVTGQHMQRRKLNEKPVGLAALQRLKPHR